MFCKSKTEADRVLERLEIHLSRA